MELLGKKTILQTVPFAVEEIEIAHEGKRYARPYHRLHCPDWVNVLPITADRKAILIRQPRAGSMKLVLETPGGVVDPGEERDPTRAVVRELEEETGFTSQRVLSLGNINPNPATHDNRCHFFVALGCVPNPSRQHFPDTDERIITELVDIAQLDELVRTGRIDHALSALCIMLAMKYVNA